VELAGILAAGGSQELTWPVAPHEDVIVAVAIVRRASVPLQPYGSGAMDESSYADEHEDSQESEVS
jgi:hypothetical protein